MRLYIVSLLKNKLFIVIYNEKVGENKTVILLKE